MQKFNSKQELIEAKGLQMHEANLRVGGVFDENGSRASNLELESAWAATKVKQTTAAYAKVDKIPEQIDCFYIPNFGYCPR